jgi:hypothetical protein
MKDITRNLKHLKDITANRNPVTLYINATTLPNHMYRNAVANDRESDELSHSCTKLVIRCNWLSAKCFRLPFSFKYKLHITAVLMIDSDTTVGNFTKFYALRTALHSSVLVLGVKELRI